MIVPSSLKKNDTIAIVSPAKFIEKKLVLQAKGFWEEHGFQVKLGEHCYDQAFYFASTKVNRAKDLQEAIDDKEVKAIVCARGGFGCTHLIDLINWSGFINDPKWLIGFSDVTVFHHQLARLGVASLHGTMPLNYFDNSIAAKQSVVDFLKGVPLNYSWNPSFSKPGKTVGTLIGGNLAVLSHLIGTSVFCDYSDKILFIEEVGEHFYTIDRMFFQLEKSGILDQIKGVVFGGLTTIQDTDPPYGETLEAILFSYFKYRNIPVAFDFMSGHLADNRALPFGVNAALDITDKRAELSFGR